MSHLPAPPLAGETSPARPLGAIPSRQIVQLSIYWFGISAIWGGINNVVLQRRMDDLAGPANAGTALALLTIAGAIVAVLVQPTVGSLSDYTISRWGRRKPYIAVGAVLDVAFIVGIATSQTYLSLLAFVVLLQFSSNVAQGPFQGYVPDLVPAKQVGLASALLGLMTLFGRIGGVVIASIGLGTGDFAPSLIGLGLIELTTALVTLRYVQEGPPPVHRGGRSWLRIALSAWGLDILRERSFVWLLGSRLCVLMASVMLVDLMLFYLRRSLALTDQETAVWINVSSVVIALAVGLTMYPAARLSDRVGRKRVIYASCAIGAFGMAGVVVAPTVVVALLFAVPVGIAAGAFLTVDWALMTDVIPKAASGRYMGISNVVTAGAGPLAIALGGVTMDRVGAFDFAAGPRAAFALSLLFYALGALLLRPVDERRRE